MGKYFVHRHRRHHAHHGQRRQHNALHHHVGALVEYPDKLDLRAAPRLAQGLGIRKSLPWRQARQGTDDDLALQVEHEQIAVAQAGLEGFQGMFNFLRATIDDGFTKIRVIGQPVKAVLNTPRTKIDKPFEHPGAVF